MTGETRDHRCGAPAVDTGWTRRRFLTASAAAGLWAATATTAGAALAAPPVRELSFLNLHTGERARVPYWERGRYQADALAELDRLLRDHRTGDVRRIDRRLYDALHALSRRLGGDHTFHVISGYRSAKSNALLRQTGGGGVAKKSYHMRGMAIDVRLPRVPLNALHRTAKSLKAGGVGKYSRSDFVHLDVGPVRYW